MSGRKGLFIGCSDISFKMLFKMKSDSFYIPSSTISHPTLCYSQQDSHFCKVHSSSKSCFRPNRTPSYRLLKRTGASLMRQAFRNKPKVSAADLAPSIFRAQNLDGSDVTRCLDDSAKPFSFPGFFFPGNISFH